MEAWEGNRHGESFATHESGDLPVDRSTIRSRRAIQWRSRISPPDRSYTQGAGSLAGENLMSNYRHLMCAAALSTACATTIVYAETELPEELEQIIVTASRSPLTAANVGASATVITREQIERRQVRYVTDLLRTVPGFAVSHSGTTGSQTQVRVRGAEANHVLVLIDGIRANDPSTGDEFRWETLSTNNVERIEIVRGPQSSLWGSDAIAGVVHVITRSGDQPTGVSAYAEGGSFGAVNAGLQGGAGGEAWSLDYGLERLRTDGTNISRTGNETDGSDVKTASLSASFQASDNFKLDLGVRSVDSYTQFDPVDFFVTGLPTDGDVSTDSRQNYLQIGATIGATADRLVHYVDVNFFDTSNRNAIDGMPESSTASDRLTLSYQTDIRLGQNLLSLALDNERTRFQQVGEIVFGDPNQNQETSLNSLVADFQGNSVDRLTWLLSARYDDYSDFDSAFTGRLSAAYELGTTTLLRANVGTGQKTPTFTERFGFFPGQFIGNPNLKPEKSTSYEIGIEQTLLDGALNFQLTLFNQDLTDEINGFVLDPDTFLFTAENMLGSSSREGVELAATVDVSDEFDFGLSYTYTDSSEKDDQGVHSRELRRPKHVGNLNANYSFLANRANLTLVADFGGSQDDIFFPPFPAPSQIVTLDSYWLVDLAVSYDVNNKIGVFARASNLLDEDYEQVYGYRTPGRSYFFGIRYTHGQ